MKKLTIGTGIYEDFPTDRGNLYSKDVLEKMINDPKLRERISTGRLTGGILDSASIEPAAGVVTHKVTDIRLYNGEVVVDIEMSEEPDATLLLSTIKQPHAAVIIETPEMIADGQIVRQINGIKTIHLREHKLC